MKEPLILVALEERAVHDDIEAPAEPCPDELAAHDLRIMEPLRSEIDEATDRVHEVIKVNHRDGPFRLTEADAELASDCALPRGDRPHDDNKLGHPHHSCSG